MLRAWTINDAFLRHYLKENEEEVSLRLHDWELDYDFLSTLDRWFGNFSYEDKDIALKVFRFIDYFGPQRWQARLGELFVSIKRHLHDADLSIDQLIVVTPPGAGDSSHRHAYDIAKAWHMPREQVMSISDLPARAMSRRALVLFNDTHGSGRQFMDEVWPALDSLPGTPATIFLTAIALGREAYDLFVASLPSHVKLLPDSPTLSASDSFTANELSRVERLGQRIYPKHPLGFGGTALLTAYYFQCPNNSLPLIWADGRNNLMSGFPSYPWSPLFAYRPKSKPKQSKSRRSETSTGLSDVEEVLRLRSEVSRMKAARARSAK